MFVAGTQLGLDLLINRLLVAGLVWMNKMDPTCGRYSMMMPQRSTSHNKWQHERLLPSGRF